MPYGRAAATSTFPAASPVFDTVLIAGHTSSTRTLFYMASAGHTNFGSDSPPMVSDIRIHAWADVPRRAEASAYLGFY